MNNFTADRPLPLGLLVGQPVPRLYDRVVECCALGIAESCVQRARRDYPDLPVGLKLGGKFLDTQEVVTNTVVAARVGHRRLRLRPTRAGFIQGGLNIS